MPDAPTTHCASCGAPVAAGDLQCGYCRCQLADLACPRCFAHAARGASHCPRCGAGLVRSQGAPALGDCPECRKPLQVRQLGETTLYDCLDCGGLWITRETFEHLVIDREERQPFLGAPSAPQQGNALDVRYRPCPVCRALMNRSNYARISGVIVDTCKVHGVWFDRDELGRALRFVEQGGLQKAAERERSELQAERTRTRELARDLSAPDAGWDRGTLKSEWLSDLVTGAARTLFPY